MSGSITATARQSAIDLLEAARLPDSYASRWGAYNVAYAVANGDLTAAAAREIGLANEIVEAIAVVGELDWEEIGY